MLQGLMLWKTLSSVGVWVLQEYLDLQALVVQEVCCMKSMKLLPDVGGLDLQD